MVVLRNEAKAFEEVARFFANQVTLAIDISGMIAEIAMLTAQVTGDIIVAEFGDVDEDPEEDDDDSQAPL